MSGGYQQGGSWCNSTSIGADAAQSRGTVVTCGSGAKGSYTQIVASTASDAQWAIICFEVDDSSNGGGYVAAMDVAIGGAGSEVIIASDLLSGVNGGYAGNSMLIPFSVPAGTRVAVRGQMASGTFRKTIAVSLTLFDSDFAGQEANAGIEGLGWDLTNTVGVVPDVTTAGPNTKSAYIQVVASTSKDYSAIGLHLYDSTSLKNTTYLFDVAIGGAGAEQIIMSDIASGVQVYQEHFIVPIQVPAATRLSIRAAASNRDGTGSYLGAILYGIYS